MCLLQVSFSAPSASLSNRKWYGNLFSTVPSDRALNQAAVKLLQRYQWTRVGVVTQDGPRGSEVSLTHFSLSLPSSRHIASSLFLQMTKDLMRQLLKAQVQVVASESVSADACGSLKKLKASLVQQDRDQLNRWW